MTLKVISWNISGKIDPWRCLVGMDADVGLLQEAGKPPDDLAKSVEVDPAPWTTIGWPGWSRRTAVARLSNRVKVEWIPAGSLGDGSTEKIAVSRRGTLTAARVSSTGLEPIVVASMYSMWEKPHASTGSSWIVADASAHRLVSDLSTFIGSEHGHRILIAGDLNILYRAAEGGSEYWTRRYATVFDRLEALGLYFVGPQAPNGLQADPWPDELPPNSKNVPTYRYKEFPAYRQLDFVFASKEMAESVHVNALNGPEEWGPSDHCRLLIEVSG